MISESYHGRPSHWHTPYICGNTPRDMPTRLPGASCTRNGDVYMCIKSDCADSQSKCIICGKWCYGIIDIWTTPTCDEYINACSTCTDSVSGIACAGRSRLYSYNQRGVLHVIDIPSGSARSAILPIRLWTPVESSPGGGVFWTMIDRSHRSYVVRLDTADGKYDPVDLVNVNSLSLFMRDNTLCGVCADLITFVDLRNSGTIALSVTYPAYAAAFVSENVLVGLHIDKHNATIETAYDIRAPLVPICATSIRGAGAYNIL